jgi:hypothetical protein
MGPYVRRKSEKSGRQSSRPSRSLLVLTVKPVRLGFTARHKPYIESLRHDYKYYHTSDAFQTCRAGCAQDRTRNNLNTSFVVDLLFTR